VKPGRGRRPMPLETMLCIYFLQHWFNRSDPQAEDMLHDRESLRRIARVELGEDTVPDESTILRFRHLLEAHQLMARMFEAVRDLLVDRDLLVTTGTIVDATLIAAPSSTKNATKTRDPEMRQTRKGKSWYFGMKCHCALPRLARGRWPTDVCAHGAVRAWYADARDGRCDRGAPS